MSRDQHADKRLEFNQKITSNERESDDLHLEERQAQKRLENFDFVIMKCFRTLGEIEANVNKSSHIQDVYDETAQKQKYMSGLISQQ